MILGGVPVGGGGCGDREERDLGARGDAVGVGFCSRLKGDIVGVADEGRVREGLDDDSVCARAESVMRRGDLGRGLTICPLLPSSWYHEINPPAFSTGLYDPIARSRVAVALLRDGSDGIDHIVAVRRDGKRVRSFILSTPPDHSTETHDGPPSCE